MSEVACSTCKGTKFLEFEQGQRRVSCVTCSGTGVNWRKSYEGLAASYEVVRQQWGQSVKERDDFKIQLNALQADALGHPLVYLRNEGTPNNLVLCGFDHPAAFGVYRKHPSLMPDLSALREYHATAVTNLTSYAEDSGLRDSDVKHYRKRAEIHAAYVATIDALIGGAR